MKVLCGPFIYDSWDACCIGVFDGVHRGHRYLFSYARRKFGRVLVITFIPHPAVVLSNTNISLILPEGKRIDFIKRLKAIDVVAMRFDKELSQMRAVDFLDLLKDQFGVTRFVVGDDFTFGVDRKNAKDIENFFVVKRKKSNNGDVSSTRVRAALRNADLRVANSILGYRYRVWGTVIKGDGIGRRLGFPTMNLQPIMQMMLPDGVYIVRVKLGKRWLWGLMSIGGKPTFYKDGNRRWVEIYIHQFSGSVYNMKVEVAVLEFLRHQIRFPDENKLVKQIKNDVLELEKYICR